MSAGRISLSQTFLLPTLGVDGVEITSGCSFVLNADSSLPMSELIHHPPRAHFCKQASRSRARGFGVVCGHRVAVNVSLALCLPCSVSLSVDWSAGRSVGLSVYASAGQSKTTTRSSRDIQVLSPYPKQSAERLCPLTASLKDTPRDNFPPQMFFLHFFFIGRKGKVAKNPFRMTRVPASSRRRQS